MIDAFIGIFTAMILLLSLITYLWFTRDDPGYREFPGTPADPYPGWPLSDFPQPEPVERRVALARPRPRANAGFEAGRRYILVKFRDSCI